MRKLNILLLTLLISFGAYAQNGIQFDPHIDVDFTYMDEIQVSKSPIKSQVLFVGGHDSVVTVLPDGSHKTIMSKENNDFVGITPTGITGEFFITVNHERTDYDPEGGNGGGMTMFKVKRGTDGMLEVVEQTLSDGRKGKFFNVDFMNTVGETRINCGGIIGPDGEIWTAEEYPPASNVEIVSDISDIRNVKIGHGPIYKVNPPVTPMFNGQTIKRHENVGWMVQIDPVNGRAVQKMYNWGRMSFEGGVMMPDEKTFFFFEDGRPGILTKFVADNKNDLTKGKLYAYKEGLNDPTYGNWILMDNSNLNEMINLHDEALKKGATMFIRLEWGTEINGKVYICETGYDRVTKKSSWQDALTLGGVVAQHHIDRATAQGTSLSDDSNPYYDYYGRILVYDPATDSVTTHIEGGGLNNWNSETSQTIANYPSIHMSNPDGLGKVKIQGKWYLVINEDLNGNTFNRLPDDYNGWACEMYLLDASISNPTLNDLIRVGVGPTGSELTGGNGTDDGKSILVDVQHPNADNWPFRSHESTTLCLTGFDKLNSINDAIISVDWSADQGFQYNSNLHYQVLFVGGTDKVQVLDWNQKPHGEVVSRENNDFIGITPVAGMTGEYYITVNHERTDRYVVTGNGGGMTVFKVKRVNDGTDTFEIVEQTLTDGRKGKLFAVDFINTVGETWNNCGGIIGPNGEIWTAEEYPPSAIPSYYWNDVSDWTIGEGANTDKVWESSDIFNGEVIEQYQNIGWMVRIDPEKGKAVQKQYNWGRMSFEGGCLMPDNKTVFLAEDGRPGILTKFVAKTAGDFTTGDLFVYKENANEGHGNWIKMDNSKLGDDMLKLQDEAMKRNATMFIRLEWVTEIGGKVYIAETGYDNTVRKSSWQHALSLGGDPAPHHKTRANDQGTSLSDKSNPYHDYYGRILEYDPASDKVTVYLESGPVYNTETSQTMANYPEKHLSNPDGLGKITVNGKDYMLICEDLNGTTYNRIPDDANFLCELYILDMSISDPEIKDLTRIMVGPQGAELTGANGTQDGKSILVNVQHPAGANYPYGDDYGVTVELTGWDETTDIEEFFQEKNEEFTVYPNPAFRTLQFNKKYSVAIYDVNGNLIRVEENTRQINISELNAGVYFIRNHEGETKKLFVE